MRPKSSYYRVSIPTKTYLKKFVHARYGNPFRLLWRYNLSTLILCLLDKEHLSIDMNREKMDVRLSHMDDTIECYAPVTKMGKKGYGLSDSKVIAINRFIEGEFQESLYKHCQRSIADRSWRPGITKAVQSFAENFGIIPDVDITLDALIRSERRYRRAQEQHNRS